MSLVGPRPTLRYQVEQYDSFQRQRLLMPPGITGWAQVNGRNELSWPERIKLDVWYVCHWRFLLDLWILCRTARVVLEGSGTYSEDLSKFQVRPSARGEGKRGLLP
jgi:lipopolysaccharide/colanic/teichoic acid biosynthesis glycosyltransferase